MWIIKNRVTGEYDRKGHGCKRDKVTRHAWDTLGRAKCHVADAGFDEWFWDADFIEIDENGIGRVIPVSDYLRDHYNKKSIAYKRFMERFGSKEEKHE